MMTRPEVKVSCKKMALPSYEKQRMERLKQNAAFMEAKGHGSMATKIYEKQAQFHSVNVCGAELSSGKSDEDNDYIAEEEGDDDELQNNLVGSSGSKPSNKKVSKQPNKQPSQHSTESLKKSGSMANYLQRKEQRDMQSSSTSGATEQASQLQQHASSQMYDNQSTNSLTKSGSMAKHLQKREQQPMQPSPKLGETEQVAKLQQRASSQMHEKESTQSLTKLGSMANYLQKKEGQLSTESGPTEQQEHVCSEMHEQQSQIPQPMQEHVLQPITTQQQKKCQMKRKFYSPGALSAYRELRKKQVGSMVGVGDIEKNPNESEINCIEACEGGYENEAQPSGSNILTMNDGDSLHEDAHDNELEIMPEIPREGSKNKKTRGPTKMAMVHARTLEERQPIVVNKFGQPIGPTKTVVNEYIRFLGTISKDSERAPLDNVKWPDVRRTEEENIWKYILKKYMVPEEGRKWAIRMIGRNWRIYKCRMKKKHYYAHQTTEARQNSRPLTISEPQFLQLINYWDNPSVEERSKRNRDNRLLLDDLHTMGPRSYAMLRHELQEAHPEHREPSQAQVYMDSRKRDPKKTYKTDFKKTKENIAQMEALCAQVAEEGSNWKDPYYDVIKKPEHSGRLRLYGDGVTKTELKKKGKQAGYIFPQEFVQTIQMNFFEKLQEANPGMTFVIPEGYEGFISSNATHAMSECGNSSGGLSSVPKHLGNQVQDEESPVDGA